MYHAGIYSFEPGILWQRTFDSADEYEILYSYNNLDRYNKPTLKDSHFFYTIRDNLPFLPAGVFLAKIDKFSREDFVQDPVRAKRNRIPKRTVIICSTLDSYLKSEKILKNLGIRYDPDPDAKGKKILVFEMTKAKNKKGSIGSSLIANVNEDRNVLDVKKIYSVTGSFSYKNNINKQIEFIGMTVGSKGLRFHQAEIPNRWLTKGSRFIIFPRKLFNTPKGLPDDLLRKEFFVKFVRKNGPQKSIFLPLRIIAINDISEAYLQPELVKKLLLWQRGDLNYNNQEDKFVIAGGERDFSDYRYSSVKVFAKDWSDMEYLVNYFHRRNRATEDSLAQFKALKQINKLIAAIVLFMVSFGIIGIIAVSFALPWLDSNSRTQEFALLRLIGGDAGFINRVFARQASYIGNLSFATGMFYFIALVLAARGPIYRLFGFDIWQVNLLSKEVFFILATAYLISRIFPFIGTRLVARRAKEIDIATVVNSIQ